MKKVLVMAAALLLSNALFAVTVQSKGDKVEVAATAETTIEAFKNMIFQARTAAGMPVIMQVDMVLSYKGSKLETGTLGSNGVPLDATVSLSANK